MKYNKFLLLVLFFSPFLFSQIKSKKLDIELSQIQQNSNFPGFAIGVVKGDSVLFSKGYGFSNLSNKKPFTEKTIIPIASVSKTFVAFALVKAIELGYFNEETPISEILPFTINNPNNPNDIIKVRHLFTHTSGIIDNKEIYLKTYQITKRPNITLADFLKNYLTGKGSFYSKNNFDKSKAGMKYNYSNIASALTAYLIEVKSGLSFDEFTQKQIFKPLNLNDTHWFYDESKSSNYSILYEINVPKESYYKELLNTDNSLKTYSSITYPDGSLKSSLEDLEKYVRELIKGNNSPSNLLTNNSYQILFKKQHQDNISPKNSENRLINQAVFWEYNRKNRLNHTGSDPGVYAVISIDFATKIGRIILANGNIDIDNNEAILKSLKKISEVLDKVK